MLFPFPVVSTKTYGKKHREGLIYLYTASGETRTCNRGLQSLPVRGKAVNPEFPFWHSEMQAMYS